MRIITGKFKGREISTVRDKSVRPATDRARGTIFNVLQNRVALSGASVLDLFAGSGSLGFESLSRGASRVVFVDDQSRVLDLIAENAEKLGCREECQLVADDGLAYLDRAGDSFDVIFADPPYAYAATPDIPGKVFGDHLLKKDGVLIVEHAKTTDFQSSDHYKVVVHKQAGMTRLTFFMRSEKA
jgi:16S rRNA (guanine(966)-N(2))-methyltransferase RsmD